MKRLILITGTATAGKSSLASMLLKMHRGDIFPIPHTTCRSPRADDDHSLIRTIDRNLFQAKSFSSCHGDYGMLSDDLDLFIRSNCNLGVSIVSSLDMATLGGALLGREDMSLCRVLVTLTDDLESEYAALDKRIPAFFPPEESKKRLELNKEIARNLFFDPNYRFSNIDVSLSHETGALNEWYDKCVEYIGITAPTIGPSSSTVSQEIRSNITANRGTRFIKSANKIEPPAI